MKKKERERWNFLRSFTLRATKLRNIIFGRRIFVSKTILLGTRRMFDGERSMLDGYLSRKTVKRTGIIM